MKKSIIIAIVLICITATVTAALEYHETAVTANLSNTVKTIIEDYTSETSNLKSPEHFKSIVNCCNEAAIENISAYINFIYQNRFNNSELKIINRILESGTTIQSLEQAYEFWLTTDEDFEFIEQMCLIENEFVSEYWYENAFDVLTQSQHGTLEADEILYYQNCGITLDQILAANIMSRKEGQNIKNIIEQFQSGLSVESVAKSIYNISEFPKAESFTQAVTILAENSKKPDIYTTGQKNELQKIVREKISTITKKLSLIPSKAKVENEFELLEDVQYPANIQIALLNKGYTPSEISKASRLSEKDIITSVKKAREILKNEK